MESLLLLLRMHWDHEPTPNPSQEGNGQDADRCLFPSWEGLGVGRFMESGVCLALLTQPRCKTTRNCKRKREIQAAWIAGREGRPEGGRPFTINRSSGRFLVLTTPGNS